MSSIAGTYAVSSSTRIGHTYMSRVEFTREFLRLRINADGLRGL